MTMIELRPFESPSFDEAVPQGQPLVETPLQELGRTHYVITQRYMQQIEAYRKPSENARMPVGLIPSLNVVAYHCYDGPRTPINGSKIIQFDRVWSTVPVSFEDQTVSTVVIQQPSFASIRKTVSWTSSLIPTIYYYTNLGIVTTGSKATKSAKIQRDFFIVGTGQTYASASAIPTRNENIISYKDWTQLPLNTRFVSTDWNTLVNALPTQNVPQLSGVIILPSATPPASVPPYGESTYIETGYNLLSGVYVSGESKLFKYIGNIWERRSINVTF